MGITCDRCGKDISTEICRTGGNCCKCGDNLCTECAGKWNEHGECEKCNQT